MREREFTPPKDTDSASFRALRGGDDACNPGADFGVHRLNKPFPPAERKARSRVGRRRTSRAQRGGQHIFSAAGNRVAGNGDGTRLAEEHLEQAKIDALGLGVALLVVADACPLHAHARRLGLHFGESMSSFDNFDFPIGD